MIFVGVDWAEAHHDVCVLDAGGQVLGKRRIAEGVTGLADLHGLVADHAEETDEVVVGIETDRGLLVSALVATGFQVYAVNPMAASRYRDRHHVSGAKSDPGDAKMLADLVRTDRHNHRRVAGDSELAEAIKGSPGPTRRDLGPSAPGQRPPFRPAGVLPGRPGGVRRRSDRHRYPRSAGGGPTPELGRQLSLSKLSATLRRAGRQRNVESRAETIQAALRSDQLGQPAVLSGAYGHVTSSAVRMITQFNAEIAELEEALTEHFEQHPDAKIIRSLPGLGTILGARVLAEFGDDRTRYAEESLAGTTPARHPSPGPRARAAWSSPASTGTGGWQTRGVSGPSAR